MDEYIKREDAMKALDEYRLSHTMSMHGDMELLMEFRDGVVGAMNALAFVPTADVVPKSEYDAVVSAVDNSTKEFLKLHDKYQDIKREAENYKSIAEHQQKLSMDRYFEIKQLKQELDKAKGKVEYLQSELDVCELIYGVTPDKRVREILGEIEKTVFADMDFFKELKKKYTQ